MRNRATVGLVVLALLMPFVALAQDAAASDPRLSDPTFIKVRDEALIAAKCADRTNPVAVTTPRARNPRPLTRDRMEVHSAHGRRRLDRWQC